MTERRANIYLRLTPPEAHLLLLYLMQTREVFDAVGKNHDAHFVYLFYKRVEALVNDEPDPDECPDE